MAGSQGRDGGPRLLAGRNQFCLEGRGVGPVSPPGSVSRDVRVFEHRVHDGYVHTIVREAERQIKMGSPGAYQPDSASYS